MKANINLLILFLYKQLAQLIMIVIIHTRDCCYSLLVTVHRARGRIFFRLLYFLVKLFIYNSL